MKIDSFYRIANMRFKLVQKRFVGHSGRSVAILVGILAITVALSQVAFLPGEASAQSLDYETNASSDVERSIQVEAEEPAPRSAGKDNNSRGNSSSSLDISLDLGLLAGQNAGQAGKSDLGNKNRINSPVVSVETPQRSTDIKPNTGDGISTSSVNISEPVGVAAPLSRDTNSEKDTPDTAIDSDNDGLSDALETTIGTNPENPDTDNDGLKDGWEYSGTTPSGAKLENANPLRKDLYLKLAYTPSATQYSDEGIDDIRRSFAQMPVSNPNGQPGIRTHITTETVNLTSSFRGNLSEFRAKNGISRGTSVWPEGHHLMVVTPMQDAPEGMVGYGSTPGRFAIARDGGNHRYGNYTVNAHIVTHEILHNIVGELDSRDGEIHTESGWLSPTAREGHQHLSQTATNALNDEGIISLTSES